jgi:hypothetical protein
VLFLEGRICKRILFKIIDSILTKTQIYREQTQFFSRVKNNEIIKIYCNENADFTHFENKLQSAPICDFSKIHKKLKDNK